MSQLSRFGAIAVLIALAAVLPFAAADQRPAPAGVDVTRPASAATRLNQSLKALYEVVSRKRPKPNEVGTLAATLTADLEQVAALDAEIQKLGPGLGDPGLKGVALRHRALAWLHGWAAFARLAEAAGGRHADALLDPAGKSAPGPAAHGVPTDRRGRRAGPAPPPAGRPDRVRHGPRVPQAVGYGPTAGLPARRA